MAEQLDDVVTLGGENRRPTVRGEIVPFLVGFACVLVFAPLLAMTGRSVTEIAGGVVGTLWMWPLLYKGVKWVGNRGD